jgi:hypothetical protein
MKNRPNRRFSDEELDWIAPHLDEVLAYPHGQTILRWTLGVTFVVGLGVHLLGYGLGNGAFSLPVGWPGDLLASLLSSLGSALWTSVAIVLFLEVVPEQRRQELADYARGAVAALRARGDKVPDLPSTDEITTSDEKLDAILARMTSIERAMQGGPRRSR